ncbi:inhibitor of growth proteins N-terminal histone-binding-domain-containing protein [Rhexocercosporidium sp. MPI-PUGE-AT-0058]|nr:inhibitor of growth proteins N-terminal histone-binding-domain-containing protein [Rhexocercosporidium sp. MPI-PUGE-AT-0058]
MPRDDLSIDFIGRGGKMAHQAEQMDAAQVLDEWTNRAANLPNEIQHFQEEIEHKDRQLAECQAIITKHDNQIQKWIRQNGSHTTNPKEEQLSKIILANFDRAELLTSEKVALSLKSKELMDKHLRWLDREIKTLQDRGDMPNDPDLPSTLRPQPAVRQSMRPDPSVAAMPLSQINNGASIPPRRHPNQYPQLPLIPPHVQAAQQIAGHTSSSAPATPASNLALQQQRVRESSLGAAANKRQRLTGGLGPLPPSNLANRASSNGPGTPGRGGTPVTAGVRAGSAGPRASIKTGGHKKTAPQGSRQSGQPRKAIGKKSNLGRVKRAGNKNSPSTNDDSEGGSGSDDEDDEAVTPPRRDADGDDEMGELDDEDGADDKKYCICQSVSFGDMVACDNEACTLEWFHWGCVGLKSEPSGIWICPVCTDKAAKANQAK